MFTLSKQSWKLRLEAPLQAGIQAEVRLLVDADRLQDHAVEILFPVAEGIAVGVFRAEICLLYTSDAADE